MCCREGRSWIVVCIHSVAAFDECSSPRRGAEFLKEAAKLLVFLRGNRDASTLSYIKNSPTSASFSLSQAAQPWQPKMYLPRIRKAFSSGYELLRTRKHKSHTSNGRLT